MTHPGDRRAQVYCGRCPFSIKSKFLFTASTDNDGYILCLRCTPWPPYCPVYNSGAKCTSRTCDMNVKWPPAKAKRFLSFKNFKEHWKSKHYDDKLQLQWETSEDCEGLPIVYCTPSRQTKKKKKPTFF